MELIMKWDKEDPVHKWEYKRAEKIDAYHDHSNSIADQNCYKKGIKIIKKLRDGYE